MFSAERNTDAMASILQRAKNIGLRSFQIQHCAILRDRILRIKTEEELANNTLCESHMRAVIKAADELNFKTEIITRLKMLLEMTQEDLVREQMKQVHFTYFEPQFPTLPIKSRKGCEEQGQSAHDMARNLVEGNLHQQNAYWVRSREIQQAQNG